MPRRPRIDLPGVSQHIIQRGNDRQPCFFADVDRIRYLDELREICLKEDCAVHAYVPMTNHVHLLATPSRAGQIARIMQSLGRRYVRFVNDRYHRTGTLWEGRCKACLVDSETCLLRCHRYTELNPVRAGMVVTPNEYRWTSYAANAAGRHDPLLTQHPAYRALGATSDERQHAYRRLFDDPPDADELDAICTYLQRQHALGSTRFQLSIERQLARRVGPAKVGRPRKKTAGGEIAL